MNLYLHINDLKRENDIRFVDEIRFLYSKQNTVMDGEFTKILFAFKTLDGSIKGYLALMSNSAFDL